MNSQSIAAYIADLETRAGSLQEGNDLQRDAIQKLSGELAQAQKANIALATDRDNALKALRVAHATIQQKQAALEARPDTSEDVKAALASMEHLVERYEAFYDRLMGADKDMVDGYRAVWPKKEGAA